MNKVKSVEHLKELCKQGITDFFVMLNSILRSSKNIQYDESDDSWEVYHEAYDYFENFTSTDAFIKSDIVNKHLQAEKLFFY